MTSGNDMEMAKSTYSSFIGLMKWGTIACAILGLFIVWLIS